MRQTTRAKATVVIEAAMKWVAPALPCVLSSAVLVTWPVSAGEQPPFLALPAVEVRDTLRVRPTVALSYDGRIVVFESEAELVAADANGTTDVYRFDRDTGELALVSRDSSGRAGDGPSWHPSISHDGVVVAFESLATNLLADPDDNDAADAYVYTHTTRRVHLASHNAAGRPANGASRAAQVSADGRVVVFHSAATNLVTPPCEHASGTHVYRVELTGSTSTAISNSCAGDSHTTFATVSGDGRLVAYVRHTGPDHRLHREVWMYDHVEGTHQRIVRAADDGIPNAATYSPVVSADGRWLAFVSRATNLLPRPTAARGAQVYVRSLPGGPTTLLSATRGGSGGNAQSMLPAIDARGTAVAFQSNASDLPCGDDPAGDINLVSDVFVWRAGHSALECVSRPSGIGAWLDASDTPAISGDGRVVAFLSRHPVDDHDGRDTFDVFVVTPKR